MSATVEVLMERGYILLFFGGWGIFKVSLFVPLPDETPVGKANAMEATV